MEEPQVRDIHEIEHDLNVYYLAYEPAARYYFGKLLNELAEYKPDDKSLLAHVASVLEDESIYRKAPMVTKARAWARLRDCPAVKAMRQARGYAVARLGYEDQEAAIAFAQDVLDGKQTWAAFDAEFLGKVPMEEREDVHACPECGKLHVRKEVVNA